MEAFKNRFDRLIIIQITDARVANFVSSLMSG